MLTCFVEDRFSLRLRLEKRSSADSYTADSKGRDVDPMI